MPYIITGKYHKWSSTFLQKNSWCRWGFFILRVTASNIDLYYNDLFCKASTQLFGCLDSLGQLSSNRTQCGDHGWPAGKSSKLLQFISNMRCTHVRATCLAHRVMSVLGLRICAIPVVCQTSAHEGSAKDFQQSAAAQTPQHSALARRDLM